ncbi:hypothetical protein O9929_27780 [Vibrio lentus]|nr:hypothetical protein [Vibrio lentus]
MGLLVSNYDEAHCRFLSLFMVIADVSNTRRYPVYYAIYRDSDQRVQHDKTKEKLMVFAIIQIIQQQLQIVL